MTVVKAIHEHDNVKHCSTGCTKTIAYLYGGVNTCKYVDVPKEPNYASYIPVLYTYINTATVIQYCIPTISHIY